MTHFLAERDILVKFYGSDGRLERTVIGGRPAKVTQPTESIQEVIIHKEKRTVDSQDNILDIRPLTEWNQGANYSIPTNSNGSSSSSSSSNNVTYGRILPLHGWPLEWMKRSHLKWIDVRRCVFCGEESRCDIRPVRKALGISFEEYLADITCGRMIILSDGQWAHINCLRWSTEVYEKEGYLLNVQSALNR